MRCETCGAVNPDEDAAFCAFCGATIERPGPAEEEFTVDCPACGVTNPWDAKFCLDCGEPIPEESERRGAPAILPFGGAAAAGGAAGGVGAVLSGLGGGGAPALSGASSAVSEALSGASSGAEVLSGAGSAASDAISGAAGQVGLPDVAPLQAPPALPPPPPAAESVTSGANAAGEVARGAGPLGRIVRGGALVTSGIGGIAALLAILAAILAFTGDPAACVDRRSTATTGAALNAQARWDAFKAAGPGATVTFTEEEITSQGVAYLRDRDVSIGGLQVYFCPDGKAEAKGSVSFLGRDLNILFRGTLDVSGGRNRLVINSVNAGNLPSAVGTRIVEQLLDRNNARDLPLGLELAASASINGSHKLTR